MESQSIAFGLLVYSLIMLPVVICTGMLSLGLLGITIWIF